MEISKQVKESFHLLQLLQEMKDLIKNIWDLLRCTPATLEYLKLGPKAKTSTFNSHLVEKLYAVQSETGKLLNFNYEK